jgi:hypothetical protein
LAFPGYSYAVGHQANIRSPIADEDIDPAVPLVSRRA